MALREVLDLPVLRRASPIVVAGADRLDNAVRWLHVSEQVDVATFLSGGELLLTTGMLLGHDLDLQERFVTRLAEAGVAGVAVRLGGALHDVPSLMRERADQLGVPLVVLRHRIAFADVMEEVHRALVGEQATLLRRAADLRNEFNDLVLQERSVEEVIDRLVELVGGSVVVEDAARRPLHAAGNLGRELDPDFWRRHSRVGHADDPAPLTVSTVEGDGGCVWVPLQMRQEEPWGRLHLLRAGPPFDELDRMAVERAATAVVLSASSARTTVLGQPAADALFSDLIDHGRGGAERFRRRARSHGFSLDAATAVQALAMTRVAGARCAATSADETSPSRALEAAARSLPGDEERLTGWYGDTLVVLTADPASGDITFLDDLEGALGQRIGVGISDILPNGSAREAVLQALEASRVAVQPLAGSRLRRFGDLGLDGLLSSAGSDPALARFVEGELGPLLAWDASRVDGERATAERPLLPVLDALLRANGRVARAAAELGVDRRTLASRVRVLEELLDADLESYDCRLRLGVALRSLRMLETHDMPQGGQPPTT